MMTENEIIDIEPVESTIVPETPIEPTQSAVAAVSDGLGAMLNMENATPKFSSEERKYAMARVMEAANRKKSSAGKTKPSLEIRKAKSRAKNAQRKLSNKKNRSK